jgi:creatinine amidohydrolase
VLDRPALTPCPELARLTWPAAQVELAKRPIGLLPIGAIEAHGPHLPLDTDVIIAEATARAAGQKLAANAVPALILPAVVYSVSFVGTSFPGTSPVPEDAFAAYVTGVLTHLAPQGYRAIICCNAHLEPAHFEQLHAACAAAQAATGIPMLAPDHRREPFALLLSEEFRAGARHGGRYETSLVLAAHPEAVDIAAMRTLPPVWIDLPARLRDGARTFAEAGATLGYFGDPASATAAEGQRMLEALAEIVWQTWQGLAEEDGQATSAP